MQIATQIAIGLAAIIQICILGLEMFAWTTTARKLFKTIPKGLSPKTRALATNEGFYNGFLVSGLI